MAHMPCWLTLIHIRWIMFLLCDSVEWNQSVFYFKRCNDSSVNWSSKCLNLLCIFEYWNEASEPHVITAQNGGGPSVIEADGVSFFILQLSGFVIRRGCGECHPSQGSFHAPVLHQSRFTFKVEFLCTDTKLTWWMIVQTKPELQSSIIQLQVMTPNVYTFTLNDTNLDVYHPATLILQTISFVTVLYITDRQEASQRSLIKYFFCELYLMAALSCT